MNILYLHVHDAGRYIQPYGHAVPTPNLQHLAEQGVLFRQAFCAAPVCSASRAALLTGTWPHCCGMDGLAHRGWSLRDYRQHIVHTLHAAGYHTALCGVQHEAHWQHPEVIGYDQIVDIPAGHSEEAIADAARRFFRAPPAGKPWFLSVGMNATHRVYPPPGWQEDARYCLPPAPIPDTPETRRDMACFKAAARHWDTAAGTVLEALDAAGLAGDTLVVCTTDHGVAFPSMKCNLTQHGCGVMLILRGPGGFAGGKVCDALVSHVDVFATICDLLEIARPPWLAGVSILPLVRGGAQEVRDETFAEVTYHAAYEPMRSVRTKQYNYVRRFDGRKSPVLPNCDASPSKDVWLAAGWKDRPPVAEALYDLLFDPNEVRNVAAEPAMAEVLADMRARLDRHMRATHDPLLNGPVPMPAGAWADDPDGLHPDGGRKVTRTAGP
jgi:arylsulfatase A-like enzyme